MANLLRGRQQHNATCLRLGDIARSFRAAMLDTATAPGVFVGSLTPNAPQSTELAFAELSAASYSLTRAAESVVAVMAYTTGRVIEEQARTGLEYPQNPYRRNVVDARRFPLSAEALPASFNPNADAGFEPGLRIVLAGVAELSGTTRRARLP